jgi:hypothetical protein
VWKSRGTVHRRGQFYIEEDGVISIVEVQKGMPSKCEGENYPF